METYAHVERVTVQDGERFPLSFQDEVLHTEADRDVVEEGTTKLVPVTRLLILRRGV